MIVTNLRCVSLSRIRSVISTCSLSFSSIHHVANRSLTTLHDKEKAAEKRYFNEEEEKLLRNMRKKTDSAAVATKEPAIPLTDAERLKNVFEKYNISNLYTNPYINLNGCLKF